MYFRFLRGMTSGTNSHSDDGCHLGGSMSKTSSSDSSRNTNTRVDDRTRETMIEPVGVRITDCFHRRLIFKE